MRKGISLLFAFMLIVLSCNEHEASKVKTTFQTSRAWKSTMDNRADAVMVYGIGNPTGISSVEERLASWKERGYRTHFQTVSEWWNTGDYAFDVPSDHLFSLMGVASGAPEGVSVSVSW